MNRLALVVFLWCPSLCKKTTWSIDYFRRCSRQKNYAMWLAENDKNAIKFHSKPITAPLETLPILGHAWTSMTTVIYNGTISFFFFNVCLVVKSHINPSIKSVDITDQIMLEFDRLITFWTNTTSWSPKHFEHENFIRKQQFTGHKIYAEK